MKVLLNSNCSFRSFSNTIKGLCCQKLYAGKYSPSYGTLINWLIRAGIAKLRGVKRCQGPCIDIMDHWIGKGNMKLFVVLRIPLSKYQEVVNSKKAIGLKHLQLVHMEIEEKSTGEKVCLSLKKTYKNIGRPVAIVCDSGSDLMKALKLINRDEKGSKKIYHIDDLSHRMALILKREYGEKEWFKNFFSSLGNASKRLHTGRYASLKPPVQNDKARFMNIYKQIEWYFSRLNNLQNKKFSDDEKLKFQEVYKDIVSNGHNDLKSIHRLIGLTHQVMSVLKVQGMNKQSYEKCIKIISNFENENVRDSIIKWLDLHYKISQDIFLEGWNSSMPISSDPIESFFSKYKSFQKRAPEGEPTRIVALLPLIVGDDTPNEIHCYLTSVSHKDARNWIDENVPETIHSKKRNLSTKTKRKKVPKSGGQIAHTERPYERAFAA